MLQDQETEFQTIEECEAALNRLANMYIPANADLQGLMAQLAAMGGDGQNAETPEEAEHRKSAAKLAQAEARYRALVEQIPAISFLAPLDGTLSELYVSPQIESILGFTAEEWLSNPILWYKQLHPEDQVRWHEGFARTLNAGEHFKDDYRFIAKDGRVVWVHGEARVVADDEGKPLFLQGVAFDITESKTAEEKDRLRLVNDYLAKSRDEALEASRAKSAFLANMSHELRTPLNAIVGFTEMLQEDVTDSGQEQFLPDLRQIHSSAKHLLGTIGGILDLSKIEAGKMDLFLETFALPDMIRDVIGSALPLVEENGNCLEVECDDDIGEMHADVTKVRQVLFNLISNAAKFTTNGTITLSAERIYGALGEEKIQLSVRDSGIGMTPEQLAKVFQSFTQADVSTTRKYGGTGLGLTITQRFCVMMGGEIQVASEAGQGSTFTVLLPAIVTAPTEETPKEEAAVPHDIATALKQLAPTPPAPAPAPAAPPQAGVLVIDADTADRKQLVKWIGEKGWPVATVANPSEALDTARRTRPAAIVLNPLLGETEGWSLLTSLKTDAALADTPVVLVTWPSEEKGYALGAADHVIRPVDSKRLARLLRHHRPAKGAGRVLVIDHDPVIREVLSQVTTREGWTGTEAVNGFTAMKQVAEAVPDLILLDLNIPDVNGYELVRMLRKTQAGRSVPVVMVIGEATTEARRALSTAVDRVAQKAAVSRADVFAEIQPVIAAAVAAHVPSKPATTDSLQRELEQVRAERDAARAKLKDVASSAEWEKEKAKLLAQQDQLIADANAARLELREHQQSIELLQAEFDERDHDAELDELRAEVERLRAERAVPATSHTLAEASSAQLAAAVAQREEIARELEAVRRQNQEYQNELSRTRVELTAARQRNTPSSKSKPIESPKTDQWFLTYRDEDNQVRRMTSTTSGVVRLFEQGVLQDPTQILASRSKSGPYNPLTSFSEFRELLSESAQDDSNDGWNSGWSDTGSSTAAVLPRKQKQAVGRPQTRPVVENQASPMRGAITLAIGVALAIVTAVIATKYLLPRL